MSKLVDKERLARLAKALDDRMKDAVKAEETRAEAAEKQALEDAKKYTDNKITEVNGAAEALGVRVGALEQFKTEQLQNNATQLEAINAKVAQADYDAKMKALDAEDADFETRIAKLEGEDSVVGSVAHAVKVEKERAMEEEGKIRDEFAEADEALQQAIDGKVAQTAYDTKVAELVAKDEEIAGAVATEKGRAEAAEEALGGRIDALVGEEGSIQSQINAAIAQEVLDRNAAILVETNRAKDVEEDLQDAINLINDETNGILAQAKTYADTEDAKIEARVKDNEDALAIINGADTVEGSIAKAKKDAKDYADQQIAALVDSAPEAMDTLKELAEAINDNQDIYDAYVEEHATAMAAMKSELQAEIDADVKIEKERAEGQEAAIRQEMADAIGQHAAEGVEASGLRKEIDDAVAVEKARAEGIEQGLDGRLDSLEALMGIGGEGQNTLDEIRADIADNATAAAAAQAAADKAQGEVDAVEGRMTTAEGEIDALQEFVQGHSHEGLQGEIDAVEGRVDVLEAFKNGHDHTVMQEDIADNAAAIEAEVKEGGNRDKAIAAALEAYSTTEEVKQILTNVVATLDLSMVNDQVVLKLGGAEGVTLSQTALDMATDADIDAIIDGLDPEEA